MELLGRGLRALLKWLLPLAVSYGALFWYQSYDSAKRDYNDEIISPGKMSFSQLRVGDCYDTYDPSKRSIADTLTGFMFPPENLVYAVSCDDYHMYQVYHVFETKYQNFNEDKITAEGHKICQKHFPIERVNFLVSRNISGKNGSLDVASFTYLFYSPIYDEDPDTVGSWELGDRDITCAIFVEDEKFNFSFL
ncbi:MAG: hypothetical protein ACKOW9_03085 [Candidatus Paceibacterota bacterium]